MPYCRIDKKLFYIGNEPFSPEVLNEMKLCQKIYFVSDNNEHFNRPIDGILPEGIEKIVIKSLRFNQSVDRLPNSLRKLKISNNLEMGGFDMPVENLPLGLEILTIDGKFNQPIDFLPSTLKELSLGSNFSQSLNNLPIVSSGLTHLKLYGEHCYDLTNIPKSVWYLHMEYPQINEKKYVVKIPEWIEYLSLGDFFDEEIKFNLPKNLTHLSLGEYYSQSFNDRRFHYSFTVVISPNYKWLIPDSVDYVKRPNKYSHNFRR